MTQYSYSSVCAIVGLSRVDIEVMSRPGFKCRAAFVAQGGNPVHFFTNLSVNCREKLSELNAFIPFLFYFFYTYKKRKYLPHFWSDKGLKGIVDSQEFSRI